jgi:hypothetical protein
MDPETWQTGTPPTALLSDKIMSLYVHVQNEMQMTNITKM